MRSGPPLVLAAAAGLVLVGYLLRRPEAAPVPEPTRAASGVPPGSPAVPRPKLPPFDRPEEVARPAPAPGDVGPPRVGPSEPRPDIAGPEVASRPAPRAPSAPVVPPVGGAPPIQVGYGSAGLHLTAKSFTRVVSVVGPEGRRTIEVPVEGFDLAVSGPDGYRLESKYGMDQSAVLGEAGSLPDGTYSYSATPRLKVLVGAPPPDAEVVPDPDGRNALDPMVAALRDMPPVEGVSGTFTIMNGSVVQPHTGGRQDL